MANQGEIPCKPQGETTPLKVGAKKGGLTPAQRGKHRPGAGSQGPVRDKRTAARIGCTSH